MNFKTLCLIVFILISMQFNSAYAYTTEELVTLLPENTETIFIAKGTLPKNKKVEDTDFRQCFTLPYICSEDQYYHQDFKKMFSKISFEDAVHGSRKHGPYVAPDGIMEGSTYEGVEFYNVNKSTQQLSTSLARVCTLYTSYNSVPIWSYKFNISGINERESYFSLVHPSIFIYATDMAIMKEVIENIQNNNRSSVLVKMPEYSNLPKNFCFAAIRHYRKETNDFHSPLKARKRKFIEDNSAIGFSLSFQEYSMSKMHFRYYSLNPSRIVRTIEIMKENPFSPTKKTFEYDLIKKSSNSYSFSIEPHGEEGKINLHFWFVAFLGFIPYGI